MKRIVVLFISILLLITQVTPVLARDPMANGQVTDYYKQVFLPAIKSQDVNLQSTVYEIFMSLLSSINASMYKCEGACQTTITQPRLPLRSDNGVSQPLAEAKPTGLVPWLMNANVAFATKPPISSIDYMAYVGNRLHLTNPVYAQGNTGFGYEGLAPAREVWTAFRNIAYLIATIGFVVLSFMIMFRLKLSAQTVIGAQQAITKLIVVFLAITFSYAIAGLIVDLIFVFSFLIITLFVGTGLVGPDAQTVQSALFSGNIITTMGTLLTTVANDAGLIIGNLTNELLLPGTMNTATENLTKKLFELSIGNIGQVIVGIAILFALFKLLFALLFAYLEILLLTILAPIMLLPDILPGGGAFGGWAKRLFANAMVFPATTFMLLLAIVLTGGADGRGIVGNITPAFDSGLQMPFLNLSTGNLQPLLGVGMILMTYKVVDMVKNALKVSAFQYTSAIGAAVGFGAGQYGRIQGAVTSPKVAMSGALGNVPGMARHQRAATQLQSAIEAHKINMEIDPTKYDKAGLGRLEKKKSRFHNVLRKRNDT